MSSEFGNKLHVSVFGQSHGKAIGMVMDGMPSGEKIDMDKLHKFLERRRPGKGDLTTKRNEADMPIFLSGIQDDTTCGSPICAIIENSDQHSSDYDNLKDTPRPSHADFTAFAKYGESVDMRGGGHFSGRLTAPLCIAGGIAIQALERRGIYICAHLSSVGTVEDERFPLNPTKELFNSIKEQAIPVINQERGIDMTEEIRKAEKALDSVGGTIECVIIGLPAGLGSPMFDGIENRISSAIFGVPAVKGIEFGSGFDGSKTYGSQNNDPFFIENGEVRTKTNNHGGILGGITSGMPVTFRVAIKPTASIGKAQESVNLSSKTNTELTIKGRHDPCIALRAVPVIEAVAATTIYDILLEEGKV